MIANTTALKGGEFLLKQTSPVDCFCPEDLSEEQKMVKDMVQNFIRSRITPNIERLENLDLDLTRQLMREMGDQGITGITFPEKYGGSAMDFITSMLLSELIAEGRSMSLSFGAHTGIGMLPLLYYGTEEQKDRYLPDLVAGIKCAAYCLTEPGSGSDALAAKSTAVLSDDGRHYLLNGQKMWITNAGFADLFTVFAKIDGELFTGFLVERNWEGVSLGAEEKKLGIKGSSTRQVFFENVKVPVDNVLGQPGKGHKIAFNILNIGRIKLAASTYGGSMLLNTLTIQYANDRQQFGQPIGHFGAIQHKLAEQAIRTYVNQSACYRAAACISAEEERLMETGMETGKALLGAAEEYAIECALMKVQSSECLDYVVDEGVQVYGGMGYSEEEMMAPAYRDARINRIFEGTNEINRMLSMDMLLKRGLSGHIDLLTAVGRVQQQWQNGVPDLLAPEGPFAREHQLIAQLKDAFLLLAGATVQHFQKGLATEQEVLMYFSDMMADIYLAESTLLRVQKTTASANESTKSVKTDILQVFLDDAIDRFATVGNRVIRAWAKAETAAFLQKALRHYTHHDGINTVAARRRIAKILLDANEYCF